MTDEPQLDGMVPDHLSVRSSRLLLDALEVQADIGFLGDSLHVRRLQASSGDSRRSLFTLSGSVALADYANPGFDLTLFARDFEAIASLIQRLPGRGDAPSSAETEGSAVS